jgi:DNA repair protein RadC
MASSKSHGYADRHSRPDSIWYLGSKVACNLADVFSRMATGDSNHPHSQSVCSASDTGRLRDWSGHLGLPSVCDDFWGHSDRATHHDARLLSATLGESLTAISIDALIQRFGNIPQLLLTDFAELVRVTGSFADATKLDAIRAIAMRFLSSDDSAPTILGDTHTLIRYLQADMGKRRIETFRAVFLDCHNRLITDEVMRSGTSSEVQVHPREVMRRAIEVDSSAIIVAHNHPSHVLLPSPADITMTRALIQSASTLGLVLHDHLIISSQGYHSMRIHKSVDPWE